METAAIGFESKRVRISPKRQMTIPQKFFSALGFANEAECFMRNNEIIIRPLKNSSEFAEEILAELVAEGVMGQELIEKFHQRQKQIRPAVEKLISEADKLAQQKSTRAAQPNSELEELFD